MDRLDALRCFIAVVETGGFSRAARQRGLTQGMVSRAVAALEHELGTSLFHRTTRLVVPTAQGQAYYQRCVPLLEELDAAAAEAAQGGAEARGVLHLAAPATFGRLVLAPLLPLLLARHPQLALDVVMTDTRTDLVADGIDLAIRVGGEDAPNEVVRRLGRTRLCIIGSNDYLRRHGRPGDPRALAGHNCLVYGRSPQAGVWKFSGPEGEFEVPVHGSLRSDNVDTLRAAAQAGVGLAALTAAAACDLPGMSTVLDDFLPWHFDVKAVWVKRRFVPVKVRLLVDFLAEHLADRPGITR